MYLSKCAPSYELDATIVCCNFNLLSEDVNIIYLARFFDRFEEAVFLVVYNHHNQANITHKLRNANNNPVYPCGLQCVFYFTKT